MSAFQPSSAATSDRLVNKVAMCGALFAGVAFVGYRIVKNAVKKNRNRSDQDNSLLEYETHKRGRIYLRRLSGSECSAIASEVLLGTSKLSGSTDTSEESNDTKGRKKNKKDTFYFNGGAHDDRSRLFFRPLSVQERIRELNLRARHFAETIMAVQLHETLGSQNEYAALMHTRSLQPSPCHTPRMFLPIEITQLGSSRCCSLENLQASLSSSPGKERSLTSSPSSASLNNGEANIGNGYTLNDDASSFSSGFNSLHRKRSIRRSIKNLQMESDSSMTQDEIHDTVENEGERLLDERETELKRRLKGFESGATRVLTPYEASSLVALLHTKDCEILERALVTVSNSAAFSTNQDSLRDAGCLLRLQHLIVHSDRSVRLAAIAAVGNLALNTANQRVMQHIVPLLLPNVECLEEGGGKGRGHGSSQNDLQQLFQTLFTLTNIAALSNWHSQFTPALPSLSLLTTSHDPKIRMQTLRLLVNLSTNENMVKHLLSNKVCNRLWDLIELENGIPDDEVLRIVTLLSNVVSTGQKLQLSSDLFTSFDEEEDSSTGDELLDKLHFYGINPNRENLLLRLNHLMLNHPHEDIREKCKTLHDVIDNF